MIMIRGDERLTYYLNEMFPIIVAFDLGSDDHEFYLHVSTIKIFTLDMLPFNNTFY
jgi:hypothetical protein